MREYTRGSKVTMGKECIEFCITGDRQLDVATSEGSLLLANADMCRTFHHLGNNVLDDSGHVDDPCFAGVPSKFAFDQWHRVDCTVDLLAAFLGALVGHV